MDYDLEAHRCPNAQVIANRVLLAFAESGDNQLVIKSIEPSLHRSLLARIEGQSLAMDIASAESAPINERQRQAWLESFDEDDFEDVQVQLEFTINKRGQDGCL